MNIYIGTKTILATPMRYSDYLEYVGSWLPVTPSNTKEGYMVEDPKGIGTHCNHSGSLTWLSKSQFEAEYFDLGELASNITQQQELIGESMLLQKKLDALQTSMKVSSFLKLDYNTRERMLEQSRLMIRYLFVLDSRIQAINSQGN